MGPQIPVACVPWGGKVNEHGYGRFTRNGYRTYAHRWAYCDANGIHPSDIEGVVIMHSCDNPVCVNPLHLSQGTRSDNVKDMDKKGRRRNSCVSGENHHMVRVSDELALKIISEYDGTVTQKALSQKYGVPPATMNRIVNKKERFNYGA